METTRQVRRALLALALVVVAGTVGYVILGFGFLDALYQTVTTVATVGFREVEPLDGTGQVFTMVLILVGVGTALYAFGVLLEGFIEGHFSQHLEARRMAREIDRMSDHVIICGYGRVGRASATYLRSSGRPVVVVDRDPDLFVGIEHPYVLGDVTDDAVLIQAGVQRARALIAALDTDADNVYVTLSSRAIRPDLVIIARARSDASKAKLARAGANRAVNPQLIGGRRMATFALQPHVAEFVDVVMHDESLDYRMEQVEVEADSRLAGQTLREVALGENTGVLLLAIREHPRGGFQANPVPSTRLDPGSIMILVGNSSQLQAVRKLAQQD